ncbi:MAG TPA: cytochrome c family protein [Alphaproteobacteria bacterium]|jgi:cytochrome c
MKSQFATPVLLALAAFSLTTVARADDGGDPAAGQKIFNQCRTCHSTDAGKNLMGPSLHGIIGRKAGTADGYKVYSPAMQKVGFNWTVENLQKYLADPKGFVPGNRMVFSGVKKPEDRDNLIAYLKQATQ